MRSRLKIIGVLVVVIALTAATMTVWSIQRAGTPGRLSTAQWRRLRERIVRRAVQWHLPAPSRAVPPVASGPVPTPKPPPTRAVLPALAPADLARQAEEYAVQRPKTVIELQPFRRTWSMPIGNGGASSGTATLINLNPEVNAWYLLHLQWAAGEEEWFHLASARPDSEDLVLDSSSPSGLVILDSQQRTPCDLWAPDARRLIDEARAAHRPYQLLCDEHVVVRLPTPGNRTTLEWTTDFLRDKVWGGEKITVFVRNTLFKDAFVATGELVTDEPAVHERARELEQRTPLPLLLDPALAEARVRAVDLGLGIGTPLPTVGRWYPVRDNPGIFVSVLRPGLVAPEILAADRSVVGALDEVEGEALVYLVAFDLELFELGFSIGTDHPRVGWSDRVPLTVRDSSLPGPDGIGDIRPLVATGMIPPAVAQRTAATFTGGFKRSHGAFKSGPMAVAHNGTHYGFVESGVVLSKPQRGLSTLLVTSSGRVEMKTWQPADDERLASIRHARQNGVPLIELDPENGLPRPGALVSRWGLGNWSGSQDQRLRTLRAGAGLQESEHGRFLVYGYFSGATPAAMARVFQACRCSHAMLLDMNALEHTYLACYHVEGAQLVVEHLISGMDVLDKNAAGTVLPRFLGFADNRDFLYLLRRNGAAERGGR